MPGKQPLTKAEQDRAAKKGGYSTADFVRIEDVLSDWVTEDEAPKTRKEAREDQATIVQTVESPAPPPPPKEKKTPGKERKSKSQSKPKEPEKRKPESVRVQVDPSTPVGPSPSSRPEIKAQAGDKITPSVEPPPALELLKPPVPPPPPPPPPPPVPLPLRPSDDSAPFGSGKEPTNGSKEATKASELKAPEPKPEATKRSDCCCKCILVSLSVFLFLVAVCGALVIAFFVGKDSK
ncbi:hypothetical protein M3Y99_01168800 [Aphelenchoides fujianensis]|nr:hypothetical protein M3Y99_01168800 [Aphelenchoides fujianensis]